MVQIQSSANFVYAVKCIEKTQIRKKRAGIAHFYLIRSFVGKRDDEFSAHSMVRKKPWLGCQGDVGLDKTFT